jgi:Zn-dependent peptidase ImmA (M78 family)
MGRIHAFVAGAVTVLALVAGALLIWVLSAPAHSAESEDLASRFDVTVVWFDDNSPCGDTTEHGGCWQRATPDVIYVQSGFDPDVERSMILHEIGHVLQHRLGLPLDECKADEFARSMGATWSGYDCS